MALPAEVWLAVSDALPAPVRFVAGFAGSGVAFDFAGGASLAFAERSTFGSDFGGAERSLLGGDVAFSTAFGDSVCFVLAGFFPAPNADPTRSTADRTAERAAAHRWERRDMGGPCSFLPGTSKFCADCQRLAAALRFGWYPSSVALRGLTPLVLFFFGSIAAVACGGASDNDFSNDDGSAGDSAEGGIGGSSQGGSSQGGASGRGGTGQGGSDPNGGSSSGGGPNGGASGTGTGGETTGGAGGTSSGGGSGGSVGGAGGTGSGGLPSGGTGGVPDCSRTIAEAQAALASAQVCDPTATAKCTGKVEDLCGCVVPVNDAASQQTKTYLELREAAIKCGVACPAIVCPEPTAVMCGFGGATTRIVARAQCVYSPR